MKRIIPPLALAVVIAALPLPARAAHADASLIGPNAQVTDSNLTGLGSADAPHIAAQGDTGIAAWRDTRHYIGVLGGLKHSIYMARSTDGGVSWGANVRMSDPEHEGNLNYPVVALSRSGKPTARTSRAAT